MPSAGSGSPTSPTVPADKQRRAPTLLDRGTLLISSTLIFGALAAWVMLAVTGATTFPLAITTEHSLTIDSATASELRITIERNEARPAAGQPEDRPALQTPATGDSLDLLLIDAEVQPAMLRKNLDLSPFIGGLGRTDWTVEAEVPLTFEQISLQVSPACVGFLQAGQLSVYAQSPKLDDGAMSTRDRFSRSSTSGDLVINGQSARSTQAILASAGTESPTARVLQRPRFAIRPADPTTDPVCNRPESP